MTTTTAPPTFCLTCRTRRNGVARSEADLATLARKATRARDNNRDRLVAEIAAQKTKRDRDRQWLAEHEAACDFDTT